MRFSLVMAAILAAAVASPEPVRRSGELSTVTLVAVERLPEKDGPPGLAFTFLAVRTPKASGEFTLSEPRDFEIDGRSYTGLTKAASGKVLEPMTTIYGVADFVKARPDLAKAVGPAGSPDDRVVLHTAIPGTELPAKAPGRIRIEIGWDTRTEPFEFEFSVP
jgi:hypothetical protein